MCKSIFIKRVNNYVYSLLNKLKMSRKPIHQQLIEDFYFIKDYNFEFLRNSEHDYVGPSVYFGLNQYTLEIGYDYDKRSIFILLYDSNKTTSSGISQWKDVLKGNTLNGSSYKDQVDQVKKILREFLDTNFQSIN